MKDRPIMECENEFCIHYSSNKCGYISQWNKTKCDLFEIDPYHPITNKSGIRIDTCPARLKYKRMQGD